jgi:hypothetical protein
MVGSLCSVAAAAALYGWWFCSKASGLFAEQQQDVRRGNYSRVLGTGDVEVEGGDEDDRKLLEASGIISSAGVGSGHSHRV